MHTFELLMELTSHYILFALVTFRNLESRNLVLKFVPTCLITGEFQSTLFPVVLECIICSVFKKNFDTFPVTLSCSQVERCL